MYTMCLFLIYLMIITIQEYLSINYNVGTYTICTYKRKIYNYIVICLMINVSLKLIGMPN